MILLGHDPNKKCTYACLLVVLSFVSIISVYLILQPPTAAAEDAAAKQISNNTSSNKTVILPTTSGAFSNAEVQKLGIPLFAPCDLGDAIYTINGTIVLGKLSNTHGKQGVTMIITQNNTGRLSGKLVTGSINNNPIDLNIATETNSVPLNIQHVSTQCVQRVSIDLPSQQTHLNLTSSQPIFGNVKDINPPVKVCNRASNQTTIMINTNMANQTQLLNNLTGIHHITMVIGVAYGTPERAPETVPARVPPVAHISGNLLLDNNPAVLHIEEIDTICAINPAVLTALGA